MSAENQLRRARLARGLSLETIASETRLAPHITEKIDAGRFAELPPGVYARAYVRAVARVVGLDPERVVAELRDELPEPADPLPLLRELARESGFTLGPRGDRYLAGAVDGLALCAMTLVLMMLTHASSDAATVHWTPPAIAAVVLAAAAMLAPYFLIVRGLRSVPEPRPLTLAAIARRAADAWIAESSIVVDVLWPVTTTAVPLSSPRSATSSPGSR